MSATAGDANLGVESFPMYVVDTMETPQEFLIYVVVHVVFALGLIGYWITSKQDYNATLKEGAVDELETAEDQPKESNLIEQAPDKLQPLSLPATSAPTVASYSETTSDVSHPFPPRRQLAATRSGSSHRRSVSDHRRKSPSDAHFQPANSEHRRTRKVKKSSSEHRRTSEFETSSAVESNASAATTSCMEGKPQKKGVWDPGNMRWKHRQPMGRVETLQRTVQNERNVISGEEGSLAGSRTSWNSRPGSLAPSVRGLSEQANSVLTEERVEGEAEFYRQKYLSRSKALKSKLARRPSTRSMRSTRSYTSDGISVMPALSPDQVSPDDAADAHDPGQSLPSISDFDYLAPKAAMPSVGTLGGVLDLANPDRETVHILRLATPSTLSAIADPLYRIVLAGIISHKLGSDAMVSFVLVLLLLRLTTDEISGALLDAEWSLVQGSLSEGNEDGFVQAGKFVQLGMIMQMAVGIPVLLVWVFVMEDTVFWMVSSHDIASVAAGYTQIIVIDYMLQGITRAFMLVFHLTDRNGLESTVDALASVATLATVAAVIMTTEGPTLEMVAYIQVVIGVARTLAKVTYASVKGWVAPYKSGLCKMCSISDRTSVFRYAATAVPLFVGSLIELREVSQIRIRPHNTRFSPYFVKVGTARLCD